MSSSGGAWAVEFDRPSHFLASGAPTGATLLKRRYLQLLGHTLVSVPYWEWERCQGAGEREQYLRSKLDGCRPFKFSKIENDWTVIDVLYYRPYPSLEEHRPGWRERGRERGLLTINR